MAHKTKITKEGARNKLRHAGISFHADFDTLSPSDVSSLLSRVPASTFKAADRGNPGRTPKSQQFFHPKVHTGWRKGEAQQTRIGKAVRAHKGNLLATARSL